MSKFTRSLLIDDIKYFDKKLKCSKSENDNANNIREQILYEICKKNITPEWLEISEWKNLNDNFLSIIKKISHCEYTRIVIEHKGGRKFNYDFVIYYYNEEIMISEKHIEFKFNCKKIQKYPQFLAVSCKKFVKDIGYAEYFYENYLKNVADLIKISLPLKDDYLKYVYQINYDKLEIFQELYKKKKDIKVAKKKIVDNSIEKYLSNVVEIDIDTLNSTFASKQSNKIYIMYYDGEFYEDAINIDELTITKIEKITKNTLILQTNSTSKINMLLRWKNHAGILFPAWQISITR